jgi:hypothetical protein
MWFYMIAGFFVLVGLIGGVASGGIFTLIFVPLGLIMLAVAGGAGILGRRSQDESDGGQQPANTQPAPLRHTPAQGTSAPATPEDLADARRAQQ